MMTRTLFEEDLQKMKNEIITLGEGAITALADAVAALAMRNSELAKTVIEGDKLIDIREREINTQAFLLLARQQPVAKDLRRLITALKIASDLERMADNAKNIARTAVKLGPASPIAIHPEILSMEQQAVEMGELAIRAFIKEDAELAMKLCKMDDVVDSAYENIIHEILIGHDFVQEEIQHAIAMAFSARYIERFADHVTNIAENIVFLVEGETCRLN